MNSQRSRNRILTTHVGSLPRPVPSGVSPSLKVTGLLSAWLGPRMPFVVAAVASLATALASWRMLDETVVNVLRMRNMSEARKLLSERGVPARVVSVPCFELLLASPDATRRAVIVRCPAPVAPTPFFGVVADDVLAGELDLAHPTDVDARDPAHARRTPT